MFSSYKRLILYFFIFINFGILDCIEQKALWVTPWDMTSSEMIDRVVENAYSWGITDLLVEVRYRGDALYIPNKRVKTYRNNEPISYLIEGKQIDPLEEFIAKAKKKNIKVHAWVTVLVITPRDLSNVCSSHLYYQNPDWLTYNNLDERITHLKFEGAYLDPGLYEVRNYLVNVFSDIVSNYNIDGLHLDYIRYPNSNYGYNPISIKRYDDLLRIIKDIDFVEWKEKQITSLISQINQSVKRIKPNLILSAAVMPDIDYAVVKYSQNWFDWLNQNIIDKVYLMAYQTDDYALSSTMNKIPDKYNDKIVVGLRAWSDNNNYSVNEIVSKINIITDKQVNNQYNGISFFSYGGIIQRNYQSALLSLNVLQENYQEETNSLDLFFLERFMPLEINQYIKTKIYSIGNQWYLSITNLSHFQGSWKLYDDADKLITEGLLDKTVLNFVLPEFLFTKDRLILTYNLNEKDYKKVINLNELSSLYKN